jgi:Ala-tRNA(Pro) deacylase
VVIVCAGEEKVMLVLPAPYRMNVDLVRDMVGAKKARLAKEEEFVDLFPDCATGAMPPFGNLYGVPVYVDRSMAEEPDMVFRIGTHRETMKITYADFVRLAQPVVGDFSWQI